jgi:DNA polymerase-1
LYIKYSKDDSFEDDDLETLMKAINENGQAELFELEYELTSVIEKMNNTGVKINPSILSDALQDIAKKHSESELSAKNLIFDNFDNTEDFNLSSPKQLQTILFDVLELPKTKKNKTGYTTDAKAISKLIEKTDDNIVAGFLKNLQDFREYSKLKTTIEGLIKAADENDIIHTTFLQFNTGTGRLSSKNPNLQNLPFKKEIGKKIRAAFIPSDGYKNLISADYSQIEMRIMAHLAGDSKTIEAFKNGQDLHKYIASSVYSIDYYDVTTAQRNSIKSLVYGLAYGLTTFGLAADLNVGYQEAKHITEEFFAEFSTIKEYLDNSIKIANENGYTSTILNRRRYLSNFSAMSKFDKTATDRIALNAPIQGSAADIIKISMLKISKLLNDSDLKSRMILQIHDELVFEVADGEEDQLKSFILKAMEDTVKLSVPIPVSIGVGANLLDAAH